MAYSGQLGSRNPAAVVLLCGAGRDREYDDDHSSQMLHWLGAFPSETSA